MTSKYVLALCKLIATLDRHPRGSVFLLILVTILSGATLSMAVLNPAILRV